MEPSVTLSARYHVSATSRRNSSAECHRANISSQTPWEPASSEVISNLITSLSFMSTSSTQPSDRYKPVSNSSRGDTYSTISGSSSGQANRRPLPHGKCSRESSERKRSPITLSSRNQSPATLTTSAPTIRAVKSSSIFPEQVSSPRTSTSSNNLPQPKSRSLSTDSSTVETKSIGNLNVKPGYVCGEAEGKSSDGWEKRQRQIKYKNSPEKLRATDHEKMRESMDERRSSEPLRKLNEKTTGYVQEVVDNSRKKNSMGISIPVRESSLQRPKRCTRNHSHQRNPRDISDITNPDSQRLNYSPSTKSSKKFPHVDARSETDLLHELSNDLSTEKFAKTTTFSQSQDLKSRQKNHDKNSRRPSSESQHSRRNIPALASRSPSRATVTPKVGSSQRISCDEGSSSIGSIDEAVEAYVSAPRLTQKIKHFQTGRTIAFSEVGDPEGFAVFCCVGMGLTRYVTVFYDELATTLKLRLITPDRPGVGDSEPYTDGTSTPLSWPDDVYAICQHLKITKFSILAHSAGAIYALATALRMPQHIHGRIHLLAPWIPPSQMSVIGGQVDLPPNNSIPTSQRILRVLPTTILKAANSNFISATSNSLTSSLPKQRKVKRKSVGREAMGTSVRNTVSSGIEKEMTRRNSLLFLDLSDVTIGHNKDTHLNPEAAILAAAAYSLAVKERQVNYQSRLTHAIWDLATQGANPAVDLLVCLERRHTIGFRYVDITRSVVIHHGTKDARVPVENVLWMAKTMKRCDVRVLEGEGHSLMASASIMSNVLTEISKEWDEWMILTSPKSTYRS